MVLKYNLYNIFIKVHHIITFVKKFVILSRLLQEIKI